MKSWAFHWTAERPDERGKKTKRNQYSFFFSPLCECVHVHMQACISLFAELVEIWL